MGVISAEVLRTLANSPDLTAFALADDMMGAPVAAQADDDLHAALETLLRHGLRELVVTESDGSIVGWGYNSHGQASPPAGNDYSAISAGGLTEGHSLALRTDGSCSGTCCQTWSGR